GLAVDLDQSALARVGAHVHGDHALGGDPPGHLRGFRAAADAEDLLRLFQVAPRLDEGLLAFHHAEAGGFTQLLDHRCGDLCHICSDSCVSSAGGVPSRLPYCSSSASSSASTSTNSSPTASRATMLRPSMIASATPRA